MSGPPRVSRFLYITLTEGDLAAAPMPKREEAGVLEGSCPFCRFLMEWATLVVFTPSVSCEGLGLLCSLRASRLGGQSATLARTPILGMAGVVGLGRVVVVAGLSPRGWDMLPFWAQNPMGV